RGRRAHSDYDAPGTGFPRRRQDNGGRSAHERQADAANSQLARSACFNCIFLIVLTLLAPGCRQSPTPQLAYDNIRKETQQGRLDKALADVDSAAKTFSRNNVEWTWRFRILKAQILVMRQEYKSALVLLKEDLPPSIALSGI